MINELINNGVLIAVPCYAGSANNMQKIFIETSLASETPSTNTTAPGIPLTYRHLL